MLYLMEDFGEMEKCCNNVSGGQIDCGRPSRSSSSPFFTQIPVALGGNQTSTIYDAIQEIDFESGCL